MNLTNWLRACAASVVVGAACAPFAAAQVITNVVETGGDNSGATVPAKWTGQSGTIITANVPVPGAVGDSYTIGSFGNGKPAFIDRNHVFDNETTFFNMPLPSYLIGGDYIIAGNSNRDNNPYQLDVTLSKAATVYLIVDNRLGDANFLDPPTFDATHMQWVINQGWLPKSTGNNHGLNVALPDEATIILNGNPANGENLESVYYKSFPAGTFSLFQADNAGQNMYSVVVVAVPEPATVSLLLLSASVGVVTFRRKRA